jgi:hypothetical protein
MDLYSSSLLFEIGISSKFSVNFGILVAVGLCGLSHLPPFSELKTDK